MVAVSEVRGDCVIFIGIGMVDIAGFVGTD